MEEKTKYSIGFHFENGTMEEYTVVSSKSYDELATEILTTFNEKKWYEVKIYDNLSSQFIKTEDVQKIVLDVIVL